MSHLILLDRKDKTQREAYDRPSSHAEENIQEISTMLIDQCRNAFHQAPRPIYSLVSSHWSSTSASGT
jgi:hypothetical protein